MYWILNPLLYAQIQEAAISGAILKIVYIYCYVTTPVPWRKI